MRGRKPWTIFGFAGSEVSMAWNPASVHTGDRLPKILWPVISQPPATFSAFDDDSSSGMSLPASPWIAANTSPSAAFSRIHRHDVSPARQQVGGDAGPVQVHVDGDGGRRRVVGEPTLQTWRRRRVRGPSRRTRSARRRAGSRTGAARPSPRRRSGSPGRMWRLGRRTWPACRRSAGRLSWW